MGWLGVGLKDCMEPNDGIVGGWGLVLVLVGA
jgi:hypothetical protein